MAGWFVTGTDTGIGKTLFAVALVRLLQDSGGRVAVMKPVASGCEPTAAGLRNADALQLQQAAGSRSASLKPAGLKSGLQHPELQPQLQSYASINPCVFAAPIAPHLAAQLQGDSITLEPIITAAHDLQKSNDFLVVEGIGGWQVPLNDEATVADLAEQLQLPVILVVGMRLGCLSQALLSVESILARKLDFCGWVANVMEPDMLELEANIDSLRARIQAPLLATIPWQPAAVEARLVWLKKLIE